MDLAPLARLDAAGDNRLTTAERDHQERLLGTILTDVTVAPHPVRRRRTGRVVLVAAGAFVLVAGAFALTVQLRGAGAGPLDSADVSGWTANPVQLVADTGQASKAEQWCHTELADAPGAGSPATITNADLRGQVASMIVTRAGSSMYCLASQDGTGLWEVIDPVTPLPADGIAIDSAGAHGSGADEFSYAEGSVGRDVTAISLRAGSRRFGAVVDHGRWTAWWPGDEVDLTGTVTLTLSNGSTRTVSSASLQH
jgi:hypothetical protein